MTSAPTLAAVPTEPPERRHKLVGDRQGAWAVCLPGGNRIIFRPQTDAADPAEITAVTIIDIEDYHD